MMSRQGTAATAGLKDTSGAVYGVRIQGSLPPEFDLYLRPVDAAARTRETTIAVRYRTIQRLPEVDRIWIAEPSPRTSGEFALFREPAGFGLTVDCDGRGLFRISRSAIAIEWLSGGAGPAHYFFSHALPLWLESRGIPVLHASAVSLGDHAVAFLGRTGIGKSTLCAGLVRSGCRFVADDGLPLREQETGEWTCDPGPPWLKLWPTALERSLGVAAQQLPRVQDSLEKRMLPCDPDPAVGGGLRLAAVYVLEGRAEGQTEVTIAACSPRDSLVRLIEHSLAGGPARVLGLAGRRLELLSRVVSRVPVKRLFIPAGGDPWRLIRLALAEDTEANDG